MLGEGYAGVGEMALQQQRSQHANDFLCCLICDGYQESRGTGHLYIDWWQVHIALCGSQLSLRCPDQTLSGSEDLHAASEVSRASELLRYLPTS
jgi:hypothetical protein